MWIEYIHNTLWHSALDRSPFECQFGSFSSSFILFGFMCISHISLENILTSFFGAKYLVQTTYRTVCFLLCLFSCVFFAFWIWSLHWLNWFHELCLFSWPHFWLTFLDCLLLALFLINTVFYNICYIHHLHPLMNTSCPWRTTYIYCIICNCVFIPSSFNHKVCKQYLKTTACCTRVQLNLWICKINDENWD